MKKSVWGLLAGVLHFVKEPPCEILPPEGPTVAPGQLCWVVTMFRWGDSPGPLSYLLGVYSTLTEAEQEATAESKRYDGKYRGITQACRVDQRRDHD